MRKLRRKRVLEKIRLIVLDVDGTLTDGSIYYDCTGNEWKRFNVKDGYGIVLAQKKNIQFCILTGRESECVTRRAQELNIRYVFQGKKSKENFFADFIKSNGWSKEQIAYIGDDGNDLAVMQLAGVSVCPKDAARCVKKECNIVLRKRGGEGAVRAFIDLLLPYIK